jgi:hypothetical protein
MEKPLFAAAPGVEAPKPIIETVGTAQRDPHHLCRSCNHIGRLVQPRSFSPSCCDRVAGVGVTARGEAQHLWFYERPSRSPEHGLRAVDFRVLLQLSVRSYASCVTTRCSRCSLGLFPLRGIPARDVGEILLPSCACQEVMLHPRIPQHIAATLQGIDPSRAWRQLSEESRLNLREVFHLVQPCESKKLRIAPSMALQLYRGRAARPLTTRLVSVPNQRSSSTL